MHGRGEASAGVDCPGVRTLADEDGESGPTPEFVEVVLCEEIVALRPAL